MPDLMRMADEADQLAASTDSRVERATYEAIADMWRRMARGELAESQFESISVGQPTDSGFRSLR